MSEYVLVSQGIECNRSNNPYGIISGAINSNKEYNKYLERCAEEYERSADNEMFVYKEERDDITEVDLFEMDSVIKSAKAEAYDEFSDKLFKMIEHKTVNCFYDFTIEDLHNLKNEIKGCAEYLKDKN